MYQINFRLIAEALKRDYPSEFASKTMVQNQNEFVKMQSLVAAYDAGLEARDVSLCHKLFPCAKLPKFESEIEMDSRMESRITCSSQMVHLCPGYSVGCALCAIFMPETCMVVCPFVGLYCGKLFTF